MNGVCVVLFSDNEHKQNKTDEEEAFEIHREALKDFTLFSSITVLDSVIIVVFRYWRR